MRKALIVGINHYDFGGDDDALNACIPDANRMAAILSRNSDDTPNFFCKKLISSETDITKEVLSEAIIDLYSTKGEIALFYFSGHGSEPTKDSKACLVTQDTKKYNAGVELDFLLGQIMHSKAEENIIILDCCFSGAAGAIPFLEHVSQLKEGTSIITASHQTQESFEGDDGGIFTSIIVDALNGGAGDTLGRINIAGIYGFADKLLSPWDQRPVFKAHVTKMITIRNCKPLVPIHILRKLSGYFPTDDYSFPLDPTYEPTAEPTGHENEKIFDDLQKYNRASLLVPVGEEHMYFAAINSKTCELTPLGKYYWRLSKEEML